MGFWKSKIQYIYIIQEKWGGKEEEEEEETYIASSQSHAHGVLDYNFCVGKNKEWKTRKRIS
jgi:hypothetical protein